MPNNLKVLGSIHENMLQGCIPSVSPQFTSSEQVEFKASVNGLHNSSAAELSERMAKSLTPQNGLLVTETNLCKNVANEIPGNDLHDHKNLPAKDSQVYWRRFSEKDVCKTQDKTAAIKSFSSWRDIEKNSLQIHSSLHQTTPLVGLKNHLNTQHGVFEAHNMSIDRDKCDTGVKTLPCVNNKPPQFKLLFTVGQRGKDIGRFDEPVGVAFDPEGDIIVADYNNDRLQVLSREGKIIRVHDHYSRESGKQFGFICPTGIACDRAGNMVVVEKARNRVVILSPAFTIIRAFGRHGKEQGQFRGPHGVFVDAHSRIIVTDTMNSRVQVFDYEGNFLFMFGNKGPGRLNYPCYTIYHEGRFYVADTDNDSVKVFDTRGTFLRTCGDGLSAPSGIAVYKDKYLLVCDYNNDCVKVMSFTGRILSTIGTSGEGDGQFLGPEALAVTPEGNIVVTDKLNCKLQVFTAGQ